MAVVGALFAAAYPRRFWLIVLTLSLAAATVEPLQFIAAGRHPSFRDVEFKSLGAAVGAAAGYAVAWVSGLIESSIRPVRRARASNRPRPLRRQSMRVHSKGTS